MVTVNVAHAPHPIKAIAATRRHWWPRAATSGTQPAIQNEQNCARSFSAVLHGKTAGGRCQTSFANLGNIPTHERKWQLDERWAARNRPTEEPRKCLRCGSGSDGFGEFAVGRCRRFDD
jgi:hypothetical protein